jgi:potassium uptake Trk family protein
MPYLSWTPTIARNSNFVDLTEEQREELGGIEYRALKMLALILTLYLVGFHLLGMACLTPWIRHTPKYKAVVDAVGVNPYWWGIFTPASMFNDLGFTLTPDSMVSFQFAVLPLILGTFLIIIGNTGFPCMLRFLIWLSSICMPKGSAKWEELKFLLDHPRRCFTLLFPSKANWWLFWVLIGLNGIDLIFFIILDLNDPTVISLPPGFRFLDGLFQAASTRTAGFAVVNIADLHPAIQVSYLIMMYISIFPIAMSMRQTNVYEEKSLGVWADSNEDTDENSSYLSHHLRRQLSFDLWFVFLGFFLIAIVEGARLENTNEYAFSLFSVLFEIVSAYGTVGLSLGFPGVNTSFSGQFRTLSKLIIIAMQIRGRHRGLPYALDRAILLPSESLHQKENEDATRRARRSSNALDVGVLGGSMSMETGNTLQRQGTGLSRRSSTSGDAGRMAAADRFKPKQLKRILSGAFSAGPSSVRHGEKRA